MVQRLLLAASLMLGTACQHPYLLIDEADLGRFDECVALQQAHAARLDAQAEELAAIRAGLPDDRAPDILQRLDDLALNLAVVQTDIAAECPEPDPREATRTAALDKLVVGEVEDVRFDNHGLVLRARIDTGASTSSLDARDVQTFERDGERWVRFTVLHPVEGEPVVMERPRVRGVRILQAAAEEPERRPVVELRVTLGEMTQTAEFTLADRSSLEHPVLIGRNILRDLMVVDVSKQDAAPLRRAESGSASSGAAARAGGSAAASGEDS